MPAPLAELIKKPGHVTLELEAPAAYALIALLQLTLRHPHLPSNVRQFATNLRDDITNGLAPTPEQRALIALGDCPAFDVGRTKKTV